MPRVTQDFDFKIHVDPSCLSAPMDPDSHAQDGDNQSRELVLHTGGDRPGTPRVKEEQEDQAAKAVEAEADTTGADLQEDKGSEIDNDGDVITDDNADAEDETTPMPTQTHEVPVESELSPESRRTSTDTGRRTSSRTEALIQAAAREVVAHLERHHSPETDQQDDGDTSVLTHTTDDTYGADGTELSYDAQSEASPRESDAYLLPAPTTEDTGDSSSHHEADDDVFSDRSPRSSMGSMESDAGSKGSIHETFADSTRSPRISDISQYDKEDFVPTARGTPRPPFRTPSSVRAMQMSSPPASVFNSPRSGKRGTLPTISRLGSPTMSAQYSPKGRTPTRFKPRKEIAPLVLLHCTLLPLRWPWASVLEAAGNGELSEAAKTLRDAWRQLQDRMGDTVLERGVLLPHPQNDFEVLEERLLEVMELPLRRRARILECGHYLGPANEMSIADDAEEDDYDETSSIRSGLGAKTHWCSTCRHEIKYDSLGPGKIFRVKVYASNGLMKAGAWDACWKEMERIDVEIEPIVEASLQEELGRLTADQQQKLEDEGGVHSEEHGQTLVNHHSHISRASPNLQIHVDATSPDEERRRRDQERLREIYGHTPPPVHQRRPSSSSSLHPHPDSYIPPPSPPSPSEEAFERREMRRKAYQGASLPELLLEATKVLLRDRKNVAIAVLAILAMMLAVRGGPREDRGRLALERDSSDVRVVAVQPTIQEVETMEVAGDSTSFSDVVAEVESMVDSSTTPHPEQSNPLPTLDPSVQVVIDTPSKEVVRIVETVTETVRVTATETEKAVETVVEREIHVETAGSQADVPVREEL